MIEQLSGDRIKLMEIIEMPGFGPNKRKLITLINDG